MPTLYEQLEKDVRFIEGMKACMNCGVCTAICPAAEVSDYDPRQVVSLVQERDEASLKSFLKAILSGGAGSAFRVKPAAPGEMFPVILYRH